MENKSRVSISITDRYLTFILDSEVYGVDILSVKEIIGIQKIVSVPRMPDYVKGIMNLRGTIIPVIDLRLKLGMQSVEPTTETAIIILIINEMPIGFVVDGVKDVSAIDKESMSEAPNFGSKVNSSFIKSMANLKEGVVMILDAKIIFEGKELDALQNIAKKEANKRTENE